MVFDYQLSRLVVGMVAFALPIVVRIVCRQPIASISDSYYLGARDEFVGMMFVVGAFLMAYNGYTIRQSRASKVAALTAVLVALFPTSCPGCDIDLPSVVHYCSATVMFSMLAYFCLGPFSAHAKGKNSGKALRRRIVYQVCGIVMIVCMAAAGASQAAINLGVQLEALRITFWAEASALVAFGVAWMTAARVFSFLAEKDEMLVLFRR
jgi:quinol-cytochrome oxidoreductase complex cytochrome b subunit